MYEKSNMKINNDNLVSNDLNNDEKKIVLKTTKELKEEILLTGKRIQENANQELTLLFAKIGKTISENQKYGSYFVKTLSASIKSEFSNVSGFSPRNLARMRKFYESYKDFKNLPTALAKLPWTFNCLLIDKLEYWLND